MTAKLTHIDEKGRARMVDVSAKDATARTATARGRVTMSAEAARLALSGDAPKGDVRATAEIAGVMAAKKTAELIPMCHPLALSKIEVTVAFDDTGADVTATAKTTGPTGVEMEALTAVSAACLTVYDMLKAADKAMTIGGIELVEKTGGKSGDYRKNG
jgi:cyclic pyranopterin phosphate synthase